MAGSFSIRMVAVAKGLAFQDSWSGRRLVGFGRADHDDSRQLHFHFSPSDLASGTFSSLAGNIYLSAPSMYVPALAVSSGLSLSGSA